MNPGSESEQTHFGSDPVSCCSDEEEPLGGEIRDKDEIVAVWYRLYEFVPGQNEIREDEKNGSESEKAAALKHCCYEHSADQHSVYADPDLHNPLRNFRCYLCEHYTKQSYRAEYDHRKVSDGLAGQLAVRFDLLEISSDEINDEPDMTQCEESHLGKEVIAGSEMITECGEKQGETHLPRA